MHGLTIHYIWECQNCDAMRLYEYHSVHQANTEWVFPDGWGTYDNDVLCGECLQDKWDIENG